MNNECLICKKEGKAHNDHLMSKEVIYRKNAMIELHLCYTHSTELFKVGQEQFILKYPNIIEDGKWDQRKERRKFSFA